MAAQVTVEPGAVVARSQGVSAAALVQVQLATAGDAGGKAAMAATQAATPLHVGGGQPLFVGADGGGSQGGGSQGGDSQGGGNGQQNGNQQNGGQQNQGQASAGVMFGAASIGQRGFGGAAARAQFQEILATRTARAPSQAPVGAGASSSLSAPLTAGPGGPQSTFGTAMASRAEATAQGRPGVLPGTVVDQVALKLASAARDGGGRVTIRLNPEELGKVDVRLQLGRDGHVRATVSVEKPETLELLQRDARALEKALHDAGLRTDRNSLEFNLQGGDRSPRQHDDPRDAMTGPPAIATDEPSTDDPIGETSTAGARGQRADGSYDLVA